MTNVTATQATPGAGRSAGIEERIVALANEIVDPCSAAQSVQVGLVDMGMLLRVEIAPAAGGAAAAARWDVTLHLRTTGPGCLYVVFFERELRALRRNADRARSFIERGVRVARADRRVRIAVDEP